MITSIRRIITLAMVMFLVACKMVLPPVVSATMESYRPGAPISKTVLTLNQVRALSAWFSQHQSGWSSSSASYLPTLLVHVKHSNGDASVINIISTMVIVNNSDGQYVQQFQARELSTLHGILDQ